MRKRMLSFSPSEYHLQLMKKTTQRLAYDGGDVKTWQKTLRQKLKELLGIDLKTGRGSIQVKSLWRHEHPLGSIEKIVYLSEVGADVPAYVCLPKNVPPPYPVMICLQGHSTGMHNSIAVDYETNSQSIDVEGDRDLAIGCMKRGFAALCLEQRSFGERKELSLQSKSDGMCLDAVVHSLMLGKTLIGERIYDVARGVDYLKTRNDIDDKRIGLMGNSGGGTVTIYAAGLLPEIRFAIPSSAFCPFSESIMVINHCACNYVPRILQWAEIDDVMGLFAPRPLVIVLGKDDRIFPLFSAKKAFRRLKRIYAAAGAKDNCQLVIGSEGHRFYADLAWPAILKKISDSSK